MASGMYRSLHARKPSRRKTKTPPGPAFARTKGACEIAKNTFLVSNRQKKIRSSISGELNLPRPGKLCSQSAQLAEQGHDSPGLARPLRAGQQLPPAHEFPRVRGVHLS